MGAEVRVQAASSYKLTEQECEIILWLSKGKRYEEIGALMHELSPNAVKQSCYRIMNKLGASTAAGIVGIALRRRIIT